MNQGKIEKQLLAKAGRGRSAASARGHQVSHRAKRSSTAFLAQGLSFRPLGEAYMTGPGWDCPRLDELSLPKIPAETGGGIFRRRLVRSGGDRSPEKRYLKALVLNLQSRRRAFRIGERHTTSATDLYRKNDNAFDNRLDDFYQPMRLLGRGLCADGGDPGEPARPSPPLPEDRQAVRGSARRRGAGTDRVRPLGRIDRIGLEASPLVGPRSGPQEAKLFGPGVAASWVFEPGMRGCSIRHRLRLGRALSNSSRPSKGYKKSGASKGSGCHAPPPPGLETSAASSVTTACSVDTDNPPAADYRERGRDRGAGRLARPHPATRHVRARRPAARTTGRS